MSPVAAVWLVVGLTGSLLLVVMLVALVRQGMLLGRTGMRLGREVGSIAESIGRSPRVRNPQR